MKVFFGKRFILGVGILLISFVTLVYSQIVYESGRNSNLSEKQKIDNKAVVSRLEQGLQGSVLIKDQIAQNNIEEEDQEFPGDDDGEYIDQQADGELIPTEDDFPDENSTSQESETDEEYADDSLEDDIDEIDKRLEEISNKNNNKEDETDKASNANQPDQEEDVADGEQELEDQKREVDKRNDKTPAIGTKQTKKPSVSNDIVNLQSEMELKDLIQTISEITQDTFVLDDAVKGQKITIITPTDGFKKENALRLFETLLDINGFSIVKNNGVNKIVQKKDIKSQTLPTEIGRGIQKSSDRFVTRLITLNNVKVEDISTAIKSLVSREGDVLVYPETNTLIIIDSVDNINRISEIIDNLDVEKKIEFVKIEHAEAGDVAAKLLDIFSTGGSAASSTPSRTSRTSRARRSAAVRGQQEEDSAESVSGEASSLNFKVITEERTNSLILIGYPEDLVKVKQIISILDVKTDLVEEGIYVVRIKNADAEQIVGVMSNLLGGGSGGGSSFSSSQNNQSSSSGFGTGTGTLGSSSFGSGSGIGSFGQGSSISRDSGSSLSSVVASTEGLRITADPATNSVIIIGSRKDYETIKEVIDELDVRRRQVYVEAAILEVNLDAIDSLGANFSLGFTVNGDTLGFGGQNLPGVPSLLGLAANPDAAVNLVGSLSGLFLGVVGEQVDPDGSGPIPPIPSFTALFQALTSVTDVNVLSTPSIITTDNEQAEIVVADVIPFPTGSTVGNAGVTVQSIERLPVGIRLSITPQIGEGDYLNLNIITEVSQTTTAPSGLNTDEFGIATSTRSADSSVVVKNGQTLVIGGLVQDRESITQNKTPILGDIPFIGNLFKVQTKESNKLNLMILLTPRIIEDDRDMRDILEEQQKRKMLLQDRGLETIETN